MRYKQYLGILLGGLYGLGFRYLGEMPLSQDIYNIYSISFIWILPIVIGIIPIIFAQEEVLESKWKQFFLPLSSVLFFFLLALSSGLEDWLCILIIGFPFLITAGISGLITGLIIKKINAKKLYSIVLLPLLLNPLEVHLPNQKENFETKSKIIINASQDLVWSHLLEVPEITEQEFKKGFFNYIGVPRPIKSKIEHVNGKEYRIGYFTDDLHLYETVSKVDSLNSISFNVHIEQSELRDLPTDKHLLNSQYFKFESISYHLKKGEKSQTELTLLCRYSIESKMNFYAGFWANTIIKDFETRLLDVLKRKAENHKNLP